MLWRIYCAFLAVCCLGGYTHAQNNEFGDSRKESSLQDLRKQWTRNDITFDSYPVEPAAGSGGWMIHDSDDEDLIQSGSGSGSGMGDVVSEGPLNKTTFTPTTVMSTTTMTTTTTRTTTSRPLTPCEKQRQASRQLSGKYIPDCLPNGAFSALQCRRHSSVGDCWCSDMEGAEIPGTVFAAPKIPDCDKGHNLPPCIFQLVQQVRYSFVDNYRPKCSNDGHYDRIQCPGSMCFCVDETTGVRVSGTEVHIPDTPDCDDDSVDVNVPEVTTSAAPKLSVKDDSEEDINIDEQGVVPKITLAEENGETIDLDMDVGTDSDKNRDVEKKKFDKDNTSKRDPDQEVYRTEVDSHQGEKVERASEIMTQPGILAGIIGGSVVVLLCVVLLVMFVVYRMRKKDEGSYPLDEPRKPPNYNYVRAPEKEFYA